MKREKTDQGQNQDSHPLGNGGNGRRDPSGNVLDLVDAAVQRQDDLREQTSRWRDKIDDLREHYTDKLRLAETERINAVRAVDVGTASAAAQVQETRAAVLAAQVAAAAEAMRTQVETTRQQLQSQIAATNEPILKDVAELRKVQYETAGGKAQTTLGREISSDRVLPAAMVVTVVGVVGAILWGQIGSLRRAQQQAFGARGQIAETQARTDGKLSRTIAMVAVAVTLIGVFVSATAVAVALILHG